MEITVFLGAPGSGKGTQAKKLCQSGSFVHLSTGDILRNAIKEGTPLGNEAKTFMDKGELVPDKTMIGLIQEVLSHLDSSQHIILDGFPRTVPQAVALNSSDKTKVNRAILFEIPDSVLVERLTGRRVCKGCGHSYHVKHFPPKKDGVCDSCGHETVQRTDDKEEVVKKRLEVFHSQNQGLVDFYSHQKTLKKVDANKTAETVQEDLKRLLK